MHLARYVGGVRFGRGAYVCTYKDIELNTYCPGHTEPWAFREKISNMSHTTTGAEPKETKTFFGHPRMLANLFTVEMWERFSFYGMQGIMIYYLYYTADKGGLGLDQALATGVIGAYGAVVYLMTILGGILGDRLLGPERTLFYSAIGIMAGPHLPLPHPRNSGCGDWSAAGRYRLRRFEE